MKITNKIMPLLLLFSILLLSVGCNSTPETTVNGNIPGASISSGLSTQTATSSPVSAQVIQDYKDQLSKTGNIFVPDVNIASALTGYSVETPSYVPEGFVLSVARGSGGAFNVLNIGPPNIIGVDYPYSVIMGYSQTGEWATEGPFIRIEESRKNISGSPGESVQIGKYSGLKVIVSNVTPNQLSLRWNDGTLSYVVSGVLLNPLDEPTLIKIAASMK